MKGKKRNILVLFLVIAMVLTISACGSQDTGSGSTPDPAPVPTPTGSADEGSAGGSTDAMDASNDPPVTVVYAHWEAPDTIADKQSEIFREEVEKESGGSIVLEIHGAGTLVTPPECYDAITSGRVDAVEFNSSYYSPMIPELQVLEVPGIMWGGAQRSIDDVWPALKAPLNDIFADHGLQLVWQYAMDNFTMDGKSVVDDPANILKNQRVRVTGAWNGRAVEEWGGAPVNIPIGDVATALERNTIDYVLTAWSQILAFQMYEIQPYVTFTPLMEVSCGMVIRQEKLDEMTPNQLAALERACDNAMQRFPEVVLADRARLVELATEVDAEIYEGTMEDYAFFRDIAYQIVDEEIAPTASDKGKALIEAIRVLSEE